MVILIPKRIGRIFVFSHVFPLWALGMATVIRCIDAKAKEEL